MKQITLGFKIFPSFAYPNFAPGTSTRSPYLHTHVDPAQARSVLSAIYLHHAGLQTQQGAQTQAQVLPPAQSNHTSVHRQMYL